MSFLFAVPEQLSRLLYIVVYILFEPIRRQFSNPELRSTVFGFVLMLLMVTSVIEVFLIQVFALLRLILRAVLVGLIMAEALRWFWIRIPEQQEYIQGQILEQESDEEEWLYIQRIPGSLKESVETARLIQAAQPQ
jgi:hypothetical protein